MRGGRGLDDYELYDARALSLFMCMDVLRDGNGRGEIFCWVSY